MNDRKRNPVRLGRWNRSLFARLMGFGCVLLVANVAGAIDLPIAIEKPQRDEPVDFHKEIMPLLRKSCVACHQAKLAEGGLSLESIDEMVKGGDSGAAVVAGQITESLLITRASGEEEPLMPPEGNSAGAKPLTPQELGLLALWIEQGAVVGQSMAEEGPKWQPIPPSFRPIYAVDISPDGQYVAAGRGNAVTIHDLRTQQELGRLVDGSLPETAGADAADIDLVQSIAFSPDGRWVATGGYRSVKLWSKQYPQVSTDTAGAAWAALGSANAPLFLSADQTVMAVARPDRSIHVSRVGATEISARLVGHTQPIIGLAVAVNGDGIVADNESAIAGRLVSVDVGGRLILWDMATGAAITETTTKQSAVAIATDSQLKHVAVMAAVGSVQVFQWVEGEPSQWQPLASEAIGAIADAHAIAWADGSINALVVATEASGVKLVEAASGNLVRTIDHGGAVVAVTVDPLAQRIVSAGGDGSLKVWDVAKGELKLTLRGDPERIRVADQMTGGVKRQEAKLARLTAHAGELNKRLEGEQAALTKATEARDKAVETAKGEATKFAEAEQALAAAEATIKAAESRLPELEAKLVTLNAKKQMLVDAKAAASEPAPEPATEPKTEPAAEPATQPTAPAASETTPEPEPSQEQEQKEAEEKPDFDAMIQAVETEIAAVKAEVTAKQEEITKTKAGLEAMQKAVTTAKEARDKADGEVKKLQQALDANIEAKGRLDQLIAAHASLSADEQRHFDSLVRAQQRFTTDYPESAVAAIALAFSADGKQLASLHRDGALRVYVGDETRASIRLDDPSARGVERTLRQLMFFGDQTLVSLSGGGAARLWDLRPTWRLQRSIGSPDDSPISDRVTAIDFHPSQPLIAVGSGPASRSGQVQLFSTVDGSLVRDFGDLHSDTVLSVRFSPDGRMVASSAADKIIRLIDLQADRVVRSLEGHTHHVMSVAWNDDSVTLASAGADQAIKVWDTEAGTQTRTIGGISKEATAIRFITNTPQILSAAADGNVRLHNTADGKAIRSYAAAGDFLFCVAVTPDGKQVLAGGQDGILRNWTVEDGKLIGELKP